MSDNEKTEPGSLYVAFNHNYQILCISKSGNGDDGFIRFIDRLVHNCKLKGQYYQDGLVAVCHYLFEDCNQIPPISAIDNHNYFNEVYSNRAFLKHDIDLYDACYCNAHNIDYLSPQAHHDEIIKNKDYDHTIEEAGTAYYNEEYFGHQDALENYWNALEIPRNPENLSGYEQPPVFSPQQVSDAYMAEKDKTHYLALQTEKGIWVYPFNYGGFQMREKDMCSLFQHIYNPSFHCQTVRLWEFKTTPTEIQNWAKKDTHNTDPGIPLYYGTDTGILEDGFCTKEHDLRPLWQNFAKFIGENPYVYNEHFQKNLIISQMLYHADMKRAESHFNNFFKDGLIPRCYRQKIETYLGKSLKDFNTSDKPKLSELCQRILDRDFPNVRKIDEQLPPLIRKGVDTFFTLKAGYPPRMTTLSMKINSKAFKIKL